MLRLTKAALRAVTKGDTDGGLVVDRDGRIRTQPAVSTPASRKDKRRAAQAAARSMEVQRPSERWD